jgi:hypothetical protein
MLGVIACCVERMRVISHDESCSSGLNAAPLCRQKTDAQLAAFQVRVPFWI